MFGVENSVSRTCPSNLIPLTCLPPVSTLDHAAGLGVEVESFPLMVVINTDRSYQKEMSKVYVA